MFLNLNEKVKIFEKNAHKNIDEQYEKWRHRQQ